MIPIFNTASYNTNGHATLFDRNARKIPVLNGDKLSSVAGYDNGMDNLPLCLLLANCMQWLHQDFADKRY